MATKAQIMGGLNILAKYTGDDDLGFVRCDHDQIWCGDYFAADISDEDRNELARLGWFGDADSWSRFV